MIKIREDLKKDFEEFCKILFSEDFIRNVCTWAVAARILYEFEKDEDEEVVD